MAVPARSAPHSLHDFRFPNEDARYRAARDALLREELELRRQTERVAAQRRALPPGGEVPEDYVFEDDEGPIKLSELFGEKDTLVTYNFMFGPDREKACPMCTSVLDSLNGAAPHIEQRVSFVVIARSAIGRLQAHAWDRGWSHLQLVSSAGNNFNRDYFGELSHAQSTAFFKIPKGEVWEMGMMNVFRRDGKTVRHFWGSELMFMPADPGQEPRNNFTCELLWNVLDLTPGGRGTDWHPKLSYR